MDLAGASNRCPVCAAALWAPARPPLDQKQCPRCDAELWVMVLSEGAMFFPRRPGESHYDFVARLVGPRLGLSGGDVEAAFKDADSLDLVELVLEIEEKMRSGRPGVGSSG
jgi:hypothetical protein